MGNKAFVPNPLTIKVRDFVIWKNTDIETHTVTSISTDDRIQREEFGSGLIDPRQSFEHRFEVAGHHHY